MKVGKTFRLAAGFAAIVCGLAASACGGDEDSPSEGSPDDLQGARGDSAAAATFTQVNARVFSTGCVFKACHGAQQPQGGLNLETDPYAAIVNGVSPLSMTKYVTPGAPDASYLYQKVTQEAPMFGMRMPPNASKLSDERLELVRSWITAGAKNN